jgi:hypothetical protein
MLISVCLEIVLILTQDSCSVCANCTIGSKIILDTLDGILGDMGHVESRFGTFGDSVSVGARLVNGLRQMYYCLINRLDTPYGTIR